MRSWGRAGWGLLERMGADSLVQPGAVGAAVRGHSALPLSAHQLWPHAAAAVAGRCSAAGVRVLPQYSLCTVQGGWHGQRHALCSGHGPRVGPPHSSWLPLPKCAAASTIHSISASCVPLVPVALASQMKAAA
jgi:hypothetical protein